MEPEGSLTHSQASATYLYLGQPNPVHKPTSHLLEIHPNIIHPSTPMSPHWSLSLRFPHQDPIHPLSSPIRATAPQLVKKFPPFYATRRFITAFTSARHLYLSWARSVQTMSPISHFLKIHLNIIIPAMLRSSQGSPSLGSPPHQNPVRTSPVPHTCHIPCLTHSS